jgi:5-hydroxyisourate hydrolase
MEKRMAGGISVHVVDTVRGLPAAGMRVEIWSMGRRPKRLAAGRLSKAGILDHPIAKGDGVQRGVYEIRFHAGAFFARLGLDLPDPPFLGIVPFRFGIGEPAQHFHLPLKISPWGFSLYRGG